MQFKIYVRVLVVSVLLLLAMPTRLRAQEWQPISPEDLALKDNPKAPGADAMILYRELEQDDQKLAVREYVRIKVFTQAGMKYAEAKTLPYQEGQESIAVVKGRTIHPDGSIKEFSGEIAHQVVPKSRSANETVSVFTLPDVTPGSILEYRYTIQSAQEAKHCEEEMGLEICELHIRPSSWMVSAPLFQRTAHFRFVPQEKENFNILPYLLPPGAKPAEQRAGGRRIIVMDVQDVAAVPQEALTPPESELRARVDFLYYTGAPPSPDEFWNGQLKKWASGAQHFMDKRDAMQRALSSTVSSSGSREAKLRKIYDRVQSLRNVTYEAAETGREAQKPNLNVDDVLVHGYGTHNELNRLFVALARAAGLDATLVNVVQRDQNQFHKMVLSMGQFTSEVALVQDNGKLLYLDPGTLFCPYGVLPWEDTGVTGIVLAKNSAKFDDRNTPLPDPSASAISRKAAFQLHDDGTLEGTLEVTFTGEEAMDRRQQERHQDDAGREKDMRELAAGWFTAPGEFKLQSVNDWKSSSLPLVAAFTVHVPHYAVIGEGITFLTLMPFAGAYRNPFKAEERVSKIYFHYPYVYSDDISIGLPAGFTAGQLPQPADFKNSLAEYSAECATGSGAVQLKREFRLKGLFVDAQYYPTVREFFEHVQDTDVAEKVALTTAAK